MIPVESRRVLVVDANPLFVASLEAEFRANGFEFEAVATGEAAILAVSTSPPTMVVLDLSLPDNAAVALLRRWKVEAPSLVIVLVSDTPSLTLVVEALKEGTLRFFSKPVTFGRLLKEVEDTRVGGNAALAAAERPNHRLGAAALQTDGVDRFFAISPGLLAISGFDGYFKMINPAWTKLLGYSTDELCERPYLEFIHPEDRSKARDEALEIRNGHTVFRFKNRYVCKDGSYRWLEWEATPSATHQVVYASARDVTKNVALEQRLRASNARLEEMNANGAKLLRESVVKRDALEEIGRVKEEVSAMLVHDLKNPLSVIMSNYDYLIEDFEGSIECLDALRDSQSAGRRMLRLLANLLDVSRIESGAPQVNTTIVELRPLLESAIDERRVLARGRNISFELAATQIAAEVDADLLMRVVENIFDNAFRHTPRGGRIAVELAARDHDVELRIGNSGAAIPAEEQSSLFDKHRPEDYGGMNLGLGLYFCRIALEVQGASIWLEGTDRLPVIFAMRLPRRIDSTQAREREEVAS